MIVITEVVVVINEIPNHLLQENPYLASIIFY